MHKSIQIAFVVKDISVYQIKMLFRVACRCSVMDPSKRGYDNLLAEFRNFHVAHFNLSKE